MALHAIQLNYTTYYENFVTETDIVGCAQRHVKINWHIFKTFLCEAPHDTDIPSVIMCSSEVQKCRPDLNPTNEPQ
jgi:hypothetical protein